MIEVTYEGFKGWLQAKEPDAIVGIARRCSDCPIATYLTEATGQMHEVYGNSYQRRDDMIVKLLPEWAAAFTNVVDNTTTPATETRVTAIRALALLTKVAP